MNSFVQQHFDVFQSTMALRDDLLAILTDADLTFTPGGDAPTLGSLCRQWGEIQQSYIDSFKTYKHDFAYRYPDLSAETSVSTLKSWYAAMDKDLTETLHAMSDQDMERPIDRGSGFMFPAGVQAHVYREGLLIFYGKASVYLQAMGKPAPERFGLWIG